MLGMLMGMGRRGGTVWRPVNAAAHLVLGGAADGVWAYHGSVTPMGGLVVLVVSVSAGFAVARIANSRRTSYVAAAAALVSLLGYLVHVHVAARSPGGLSELLSVGEMRALYLTLGIALVAGTRFALAPAGRGERS